MSNVKPTEHVVEAKELTALELRAGIFAKTAAPKRRSFTFGGMPLEIIQPSIGKIYSKQFGEGKNFIVAALIEFAVAPGTNERIFTDEDYDAVMEMPMTAEMSDISTVITDLFGIKVDEKVKN